MILFPVFVCNEIVIWEKYIWKVPESYSQENAFKQALYSEKNNLEKWIKPLFICPSLHPAGGGMWDADDDCCTQRCTDKHPCTEGQGHCTSNTDCQVMLDVCHFKSNFKYNILHIFLHWKIHFEKLKSFTIFVTNSNF